jgi:hypothetical protein
LKKQKIMYLAPEKKNCNAATPVYVFYISRVACVMDRLLKYLL